MTETQWFILEWVAAVFGLANIALIIRRSVWNYPAALVMVALYGAIFWHAKLYSDAGLQGFFFAMNVAGWLAWHSAAADEGQIRVNWMSWGERIAWLAASLAATLGWGWFMARNTDASLPLWDACVAMFSVAGQFLMIRRKIENWVWWIAVNLVSVGLYWTKGLMPTAGLYAVFLVMAVLGLFEWRRAAGGERIIV